MKPLFKYRLLALLLPLFAGFLLSAQQPPATTEKAVFAGGCFWCMESEFQSIDGVIRVVSGYTGGEVPNPTYAQVSTGKTGHVEAVLVEFDPAKVGYAKLLEIFWDNIDPLDDAGQFCDKGSQYRAAIFTYNPLQEKLAAESKARAEKRFGQPIATGIRAATPFWEAEAYHQDYYSRERLRYQSYRMGCGRDARLDKLRNMGNRQ